MVGMQRCKSCGYLHVGPAPEKCPVCGAPQSFFAPFGDPGDLSGTRTLDNLRAAFAGESQANRRYTLYARIAELEGAEAARAAFDRAATEETAHALGHLAYMGAFGETDANLALAVDGEQYETAEMYPEFARIAEEEGFDEIAHYFRSVGGLERQHRDGFTKARD